MGIKPNFTRADVAAELKRRLSAMDTVLIQTLRYLGEQCVAQARTSYGYKDQTGNLTNSKGYIVVRNGVIVDTDFQATATPSVPSSTNGVKVGRDLAISLAAEFPQGYALIVVAGMDYATAVESRGLDVLSSAEKLAQTELPRMLADLKVDLRR